MMDLGMLLKFNGIIIRNYPGIKRKIGTGGRKGEGYKLGMITAVCKLNV